MLKGSTHTERNTTASGMFSELMNQYYSILTHQAHNIHRINLEQTHMFLHPETNLLSWSLVHLTELPVGLVS